MCIRDRVGPIEWDRFQLVNSPNSLLGTFLSTDASLAPANLSSFNNASFQSQRYDSEFWSIEASKTIVGWDVAKILIGARYIDYDEDFTYISQSAAGVGQLNSDVTNQLFGLQIGLDLLYPVGQFAYADFRGRAGGYLNFADADVSLVNAGAAVFANNDDDEEIAGMFEIGTGFRYQVGEALSVRVGTELWYLTGVATAPDQPRSVLSTSTGNAIRVDDDILFYGLTFGAELRL